MSSIAKNLSAVEIDEGQVSQVIHNLVVNTREAMAYGGLIRIKAGNVNVEETGLHLERGKYVKITVEDEGVGIAEEHLSKIFDPYFTTKKKGGGLGLATVYSIVKNHNGYVGVESEVGVGTKLHIYLPAVDKSETAASEPSRERIISGHGRILVMDDEEIIREVSGEMLRQIGYEVEYARDGAEAIEIYRKAKESNREFDVVIMDLTIPGGMGGKEAIEKLREIDPDVKAIVSSGYSNDPVMSEFKKYGFSDVVAKPYKTEELSKVLYSIIKDES